jgi:pimeloyl-ACP methyl ester carboxylesterase
MMDRSDFRWTLRDMGSLKPSEQKALLNKDQGIDKLEIVNLSSDNPSGRKVKCKFSLYYSFIKPSNTNSQTHKNVLFIPGGPGTIFALEDLDPAKHGNVNALELLEADGHNVAYLHVRGSGLSKIPRSNKFDRFLRADYVVKDIERLRLHLLGKDTPWDAIWGESHGSLIAQRYAYKYGTAGVKKLVLLAPPSRSLESQRYRRDMMVSNLEAIIKSYRGNASKNKKALEGPQGENPNVPNQDEPSKDLSFVTDQHIREIKSRFRQTLKELDHLYASMSFVMENYADLKKRDSNLKLFPYPEEFFRALRYLQLYGRPEKNLKFPIRTEQGHFDAALLMAHYLTLPKKRPNARRDRRGTFRRTPSIIRDLSPDRRIAYEKSLEQAQEHILHDRQLKSRRAYYVFGIYDGISRWILEVMDRQIQKDGFFRSQDMAPSVIGRVARDLVKKIGTVPGEAIYPWNPGYYKHNVPTLILRGGADAMTAGGQAESFFEDGLANKNGSVLMEIPGMGHLWRDSMPMMVTGGKQREGFKILQTLVKEFLAKPSASTFLNDLEVKEIIDAIGISVWPAQPRGRKLAKPKVEKLISLERNRKELWDTIMRLRRGITTAVEKKGNFVRKPSKTNFSRPRLNN